MKTNPVKKKPVKRTAKREPIPASKLLRAESARLNVLIHAMPDAAHSMIEATVWAYDVAAAFLDSLGAPEKLQRYIPAKP